MDAVDRRGVDGTWVAALFPPEGVGTPAPCCPLAVTDAATAVLGTGPVAWAAHAAWIAGAKVVTAVPDFVTPASTDAVRRATEACTFALLEHLQSGQDPATVRVPSLVTAGNRDVVHRGLPLDQVLRAMWTAHAHVHQQLLVFLEEHLGPGLLGVEVRRVTELSFAFAEALTAQVAKDFIAERETWLDSVPALRRQIVEDIVAGRRPSSPDPGRALNLDLTRHVVGAVVWTEIDESVPSVLSEKPGDPVRISAAMASASRASGSLVIPITPSEAWVWLAFSVRPSELASTLRDAVSVTAGVRVALGPVREGIDGVRHSHLAALRTRRVAEALATLHPMWLASHAELDLLALLIDEPEQARWFVRDQLGALASNDRRTAELRRTLQIYLAFGRSRAAAAKSLHIVPNTVAYRVRQAVDLLDGGLPSDTLRLRVALEMYELGHHQRV